MRFQQPLENKKHTGKYREEKPQARPYKNCKWDAKHNDVFTKATISYWATARFQVLFWALH